MPFQSEKQRRYLWANEPEIAREWTDRYGANQGGIMRVPFYEGTDINDPLYQGLGHNLGDTLSSIGTTISDALITPLGSATDEGLPSLDITGKPNYGFEEMDKWGINRMNLEKEDEVVSRSFKDHDNLKSWLDANPEMGENIKRKAIDFYEGAKDVGRYGINKAQAFKKMLLSGAGAAMKLPLGIMNFRNPLDPNSANYNRNLKDQINYLSGTIGTQSSPYQFRSGKGSSVLAGKNLVSMFGTNDYNKMLQKRIDYFNKFKEKRGLTIAQNKKLQDAIAEKKAADAAAAAANRRKVEQYTGRPMSDYRSSRPASERQFTGHGKSGMGRSADRFA